jgi:DNA repair protein RAD50
MTRKIEQMNKMIRTLNGGKDYTSNFYKLKVAENVAEDLTKYIEALEGAILEAHTSQIAALNRLIRKLWRNVYNGNDVDYVEIKVDFVSSREKKRNYFYRVVQVTGARELDMQGHCSAGQKFLACLVIRMALAELSSPGCGILALDEPTTSLDRETVQNLSDTLSRVVNVKGENNFQLLVVTHDEEFLKALTRAQSVPHYYTVHRNQASISVIKKEYA